MKWACPTCGTPSDQRYCPRHRRNPNATRNPARDLNTHKRWARAVKNRDGHRCTVCGTTEDLQAHHLRPGYNLADGITLCRPHHREIDPYAR